MSYLQILSTGVGLLLALDVAVRAEPPYRSELVRNFESPVNASSILVRSFEWPKK